MSELGIGLMSGTSLDGIDAALVRFDGERPAAQLEAFTTVSYAPDVRTRILETIRGGRSRDCALLHVMLGGLFGDAASRLLERSGTSASAISFVASHGQTIWHEPGRATLQLGDPAVIAERVGIRVVSDFRSRDVAAGGQGAPLVPMADCLLFADANRPRLLLNLGGMANVTWVPAAGALDGVVAFDTGPGVSVIDAVARATSPHADFDEGGARGARGAPRTEIVDHYLADAYFAASPPKSTGRERFGVGLADDLTARVMAAGGTADDAVATAVALTARSVADQVERWLPAGSDEIVASGGGVRNPALMGALAEAMPARTITRFDEHFFDGDAKEAVAFALLGWLRLRNRPGNVPAATGAAGPRRLGAVTEP